MSQFEQKGRQSLAALLLSPNKIPGLDTGAIASICRFAISL
jgi:hypothetical protein